MTSSCQPLCLLYWQGVLLTLLFIPINHSWRIMNRHQSSSFFQYPKSTMPESVCRWSWGGSGGILGHSCLGCVRVRSEASALGVQPVGKTGPGAPETQDHKHRDPQQQDGAQGPEEDPKEGSEFQAQLFTALAPGRVDGGVHTAGDRGGDAVSRGGG